MLGEQRVRLGELPEVLMVERYLKQLQPDSLPGLVREAAKLFQEVLMLGEGVFIEVNIPFVHV